MSGELATDPHGRLRELGLELPTPPQAVAAYVPVTVSPIGAGRVIAFVAGQLAIRDGVPSRVGIVPDEVTVEDAVDNAKACGLSVLAQLEKAVGLANIEQLMQVSVFVRSSAAFTDHPKVANGASELFVAVLGDAGRHARAAVGVIGLPFGAPVEVTAVAIARTSNSAVWMSGQAVE
jgi:enamine deaminase RidA (YjgF/YER057c/UK114 family)